MLLGNSHLIYYDGIHINNPRPSTDFLNTTKVGERRVYKYIANIFVVMNLLKQMICLNLKYPILRNLKINYSLKRNGILIISKMNDVRGFTRTLILTMIRKGIINQPIKICFWQLLVSSANCTSLFNFAIRKCVL